MVTVVTEIPFWCFARKKVNWPAVIQSMSRHMLLATKLTLWKLLQKKSITTSDII